MEQPAEKPYEFVPFVTQPPQRQPAEGHHRLVTERLSGWFKLRLIARRPVQVASGHLEVKQPASGEEVVAQQVTLKQGGKPTPVLPGSSLKGALRSMVEILSPSCVRVVSWPTRQAIPNSLSGCSDLAALCPACRMFGMTGPGRESYLGQVQVGDGWMLEGKIVYARVPLLWSPARGRGGLPPRYLNGQRAKGRKLYYHGTVAKGPDTRLAAGTGAVFASRVDFTNLTSAELGLLLTALGQHRQYPFLLKIGSAKPVGMGSVEAVITDLNLLGDISRTGRAGAGLEVLNEEALKVRCTDWLAAAEPLLDQTALKNVWAVLKKENLSRPAPEGLY